MTVSSPNLSLVIAPSGGVMDSRTPGAPPVDPGAIYVSLSGSDTNNGSIGAPYRNPIFAASRLTTGQTLYFRGGTYDVPTQGGTAGRTWGIYPAANYCTMRPYPGEAVTIRGGINGTNFGVFPTGATIGTGPRMGTHIIGFTVKGMVTFAGCMAGGTRPSRVESCDISVGGDGLNGTNQGGAVWFDDSRNIELINCYVHDNGFGSESNSTLNDGLIMGYEIWTGLIDRCTFVNSAGSGITLKDDVEHLEIRNCWINNIPSSGIMTGNNTADPYDWSVSIHNNVFTNVAHAVDESYGALDFRIMSSLCYVYNNTFRSPAIRGGDLSQFAGSTSVQHAWFNNIHVASNRYINYPYPGSTSRAVYLDYNTYYGAASPRWYNAGVLSTTLPAWRTSIQGRLAGAEVASHTNDPGFLNGSGTYSVPVDFKRATYTADGRGGSWPTVRGAYITGSEIIGAVL